MAVPGGRPELQKHLRSSPYVTLPVSVAQRPAPHPDSPLADCEAKSGGCLASVVGDSGANHRPGGRRDWQTRPPSPGIGTVLALGLCACVMLPQGVRPGSCSEIGATLFGAV